MEHIPNRWNDTLKVVIFANGEAEIHHYSNNGDRQLAGISVRYKTREDAIKKADSFYNSGKVVEVI